MSVDALRDRLKRSIERLEKRGVHFDEELSGLAFLIIEHIAAQYKFKEVPGHEFEHTFRVLELSLLIGNRLGCDLKILTVCSLLHDIARMINPNTPNHSLKSAELAEKFLKQISLQEEYGVNIESVKNCIAEHSYSAGLTPSSLESKVLQDADRLDALGAIGIARVFAYGGYLGRPIYSMLDPRDKSGSLGHFYEKIFRLPDLMNTKIAEKIAKKRLEKVMDFINAFEKEIELGDI